MVLGLKSPTLYWVPGLDPGTGAAPGCFSSFGGFPAKRAVEAGEGGQGKTELGTGRILPSFFPGNSYLTKKSPFLSSEVAKRQESSQPPCVTQPWGHGGGSLTGGPFLATTRSSFRSWPTGTALTFLEGGL